MHPTIDTATAYLAGVVAGDGWCTRTLGLRVKDRPFVEAFAWAIHTCATDLIVRVNDAGPYCEVRTSNKTGRWNHLRAFQAVTSDERRCWLRGLFDSEGNADLRPMKTSPQAKTRRVAIFSTNHSTLERAVGYLAAEGIPTTIRLWKGGPGHKGTLPVFGLVLVHGQENFRRFAVLVGSNIPRKQAVLDAIPNSYQPAGHHSRAGQLGTAKRKARQAAGGRY